MKYIRVSAKKHLFINDEKIEDDKEKFLFHKK